MEFIERFVAISAGLLYIALEGPKLWNWIMNKFNPQKTPADSTEQKSPKPQLKFRDLCGIIFVIAGLFWLFSADRKRAEAEMKLAEQKMIIKADYEAKLKDDDTNINAATLAHYSWLAFQTGDFSYSAVFFEKANNAPHGTWWAGTYPTYLGAKLGLNPTEEGVADFDYKLDELVLKFKSAQNDPNNILQDKSQIQACLDGLLVVEKQLPENQRGHIQNTIQQMILLRNQPHQTN